MQIDSLGDNLQEMSNLFSELSSSLPSVKYVQKVPKLKMDLL